MALGTATVVEEAAAGKGTLRADLLSFAGDDAYAANGTTGFQAFVREALGRGNVEVIGVLPQDCGGYLPVYDKAGDRLKVFYVNADAADGPMIEVPNGDISAATFRLIVLSH